MPTRIPFMAYIISGLLVYILTILLILFRLNEY